MKCSSLALGLEGLQHYNYSTLWLEQGNYTLPDKEVIDSNGSYRFVWLTGIVIRSIDTSSLSSNKLQLSATVQCENGFGLSFIYVTNITLRGIKFVGCGALQNTTSKIPNASNFEEAIFALYFLYCSTVTLQYVTIRDTPGTGMVMYGTIGKNEITNCSFISNSVKVGLSGGGGLYIEFPYCVPNPHGDHLDCSKASNVPFWYVSNSVYYITSCHFHNNTARVKNHEDYTFILPHRQTHLAFGRGGGLSVYYKGNCTNNIVQVSNVNFTSNTALWGGGLFIEHQDNSYKNMFILESSSFTGNEVLYKSDQTKGTGGGAVRLGYIFFGGAHVSSNSITFIDVNFEQNKAYFGGGLSFYTPKEPEFVTNLLEFQNCTWTSNVARVGSAVDLALWHATHSGAVIRPTFTNCTFVINNGSYTHKYESYSVGIGAFYSDSIPVLFTEFVKFESNQQSALACIGTIISFESGCEAIFFNNSGRNGGAIALMGLASLEVSNETKLKFINNSAAVKGGAIFGASVGNRDLISSRNCFVRYCDLEITPTEWSSTFVFEGNTANSKTNSIFATSLLSCLWGGAYGSTTDEADNVFCWNSNDTHPKQWIYSTNCSNEILTSPAIFVANSSENTMVSLSVFPGISKSLPFYTQDDRDHNVTDLTVMTASIIRETDQLDTYIDSSSLYISDNAVKLHGKPDTTAKVKLETIDLRVISYSFKVEFSECPLGMIFVSDTVAGKSASECRCAGDSMYGSLVKCNYNQSKLLRGAWFGKINSNSNKYVAGLCPYISSLTSGNEQLYTLPQDYVDLCKHVNRTGALCGHCLPNYGPIVNGGENFDCHYCPPSVTQINWIFYLLTEFFPIFVFFLIVVLFNISVTSGPANSFVFFAQVLTTVYKIDGDGTIQLDSITSHADTLKAFYVIPYDIWNQKFFQPLLPKFCITPSITTLQLITAGYVTAFFPLLLVIIFSFFVWAYGKGFGPVVCLCRPLHTFSSRFRRMWDLQESMTHALATFILVSYSRFTFVSFLLLVNVPLFNSTSSVTDVLYYDGTIQYLGPDHIPYLVASVFVLLTFVAIPPLLLIGPSIILLIKRSIERVYRSFQLPTFLIPGALLSQFLNAFHGCYKDGTGGENGNGDYRWFAGFYFLLRVVLYLVYASTPNWFLQYVVQQLVCIIALMAFVILQPYKRMLFNLVDSTIFAILAAISTLSMYNYYLTKLGEHLSSWAFAVQYVLIFVPLVYISIYSMQRVCKKLHQYQHYFIRRSVLLNEVTADVDDMLDYTDNERRYRDVDDSYQKRSSNCSSSGAKSTRNGSESHSLLPNQEDVEESACDTCKIQKNDSYGSAAETEFTSINSE